MAKIFNILLVASIAIALCAAEAPQRSQRQFRLQQQQRRSRFFARQEVAEEAPKAVTPYPSADELKPEIAFEEVEKAVGEEIAAEEVARQPDNTYGPPEFDLAAAPRTPDNTYGPPEFDNVPAVDEPAVDEPVAADIPAADEPAIAEQDVNSIEETAADENADIVPAAQAARLTALRRRAKLVRPAKLRAAPKARIVRLQQQQQFQPQPMLFYSAAQW